MGCHLQQSSGCLGCDNSRNLLSLLSKPSKGQKIQAQTVTKPNPSEDFWTSSTFDMDNSAVQSRGSISSISTSNQIVDGSGSGNGNLPSEFVNHGRSLAHLLFLFDNEMYAILFNLYRAFKKFKC